MNAVSSTLARPVEGKDYWLRFALVAFVLVIPIGLTLTPSLLKDPDVWWHLQTGHWILQHHGVPSVDPFSSAPRPWVAYSWLYELVIYSLYLIFGLVGVVGYQVVLSIAIIAALFLTLDKWQTKFLASVALTLIAVMALAPVLIVRSWMFTIFFFILVINILGTARATGDGRRLYWLPLIFAFWANLHVQFLYGLFVVGLAAGEPLLLRLLKQPAAKPSLSEKQLWLTAAASFLATFATPYHWKLYRVLGELMSRNAAPDLVQEVNALDFRSASHYLVLLLALVAAYTLGRRRELRPFPVVLFLVAALVSFRATRDLWFIVVVALFVIAAPSPAPERTERLSFTRRAKAMLVLVVLLVGFGFFRMRHIANDGLERTVEDTFPVRAVRLVRQGQYPGPLFNYYDWGGYLIWALPERKVSIDGRSNLYGYEQIKRNWDTWGGRDWGSDPHLRAARLVIGGVGQPLTGLLRDDPSFQLVYEDKVAAVYVRRVSQPAPAN